MSRWKSVTSSIAVHAALVGGIAFILANDPPSVRGGLGLSGATHTHFNMTVSRSSPVDEVKAKTPVAPIREGLEVPKTQELPTEVKNAKPREIDTPPAREESRSDGDSSTAAAGRQGQGGSGNTASDSIGNSDRSNALGIYLLKMQRKIQSNLEAAGYLAFEYRAVLALALKKNGSVEKITVLKSSGDRNLDQKAINAVKRSIPFDAWEYDQTIQVPVIFRATD